MVNSHELILDVSIVLDYIKKLYKYILGGTFILTILFVILFMNLSQKKYICELSIYLIPHLDSNVGSDNQSTLASFSIVKDYSKIYNSTTQLYKVDKYLHLQKGYSKSSLTIDIDKDSWIINIKCISNSPQLSKKILQESNKVFKSKIEEINQIEDAIVIDSPEINEDAVEPSLTKTILKSGVSAFFIALLGTTIQYKLNYYKLFLDNKKTNIKVQK